LGGGEGVENTRAYAEKTVESKEVGKHYKEGRVKNATWF